MYTIYILIRYICRLIYYIYRHGTDNPIAPPTFLDHSTQRPMTEYEYRRWQDQEDDDADEASLIGMDTW